MNVAKLLTFPEEYQRLPVLPDDPEGCVNYGLETLSAQCVVQALPISLEKAMPFGHPREVIAIINETLKENEALIEVDSGTNSNGVPFIYSIVKMKTESSGVQYKLTFHGKCGNEVLGISGFFKEKGVTGRRSAIVWDYLRREGVVSEDEMSLWMNDPYDENSDRPFQMNLSESRKFDKVFPNGPLSKCRELIQFWME